MLVVKTSDGRIITPPREQQRFTHLDSRTGDRGVGGELMEFRCPVCGECVVHPFTVTGRGGSECRSDAVGVEYRHEDGRGDCTGSDRMTLPHKRAVEASLAAVDCVVSDGSVITVEKRVGGVNRFVTADVHCATPCGERDVVVEVFHRSASLGLKRRLEVFFEHGYGVFMVFVLGGRYGVRRVESHISEAFHDNGGCECVVGRFDPETFHVSLGTMLTGDRVTPSVLMKESVPEYVC